MSDASAFTAPAEAPSRGLVRLVAPGLFSMSVIYCAVTTAYLPGVADTSAATDAFLAAIVPGLVVVALLWAARPATFPRRRRRALVAVTILGAAAAAMLPMLFAAA